MKYNIEILSRRFFPWFWQETINMKLVDILMASLTVLNQGTEDNEIDVRQRVGYSIQRLSLESSLNDKFDNEQRRIKIVNGSAGGAEFVYNESENPLEQDIIYVFNESESTTEESTPYFFNETESDTAAATNFTVFVPSSLQESENSLKSWIDLVLMYGTNYIIIYT